MIIRLKPTFGCASQRTKGEPKFVAPGPGHYFHHGQFDPIGRTEVCEAEESGIFNYLKPVPVGFNTRTERFKDVVNAQNPGPGTYELAGVKLNRQKTRGTNREEQHPKIINAPSIPSHNNVYGYEETSGTLKD